MNKVSKILGILIGIAIVVMGLRLLNVDTSYVRDSVKFGGDFYTEIYGVTRNAVQAVNHATKTIANCIGWLMISVGSITAISFLSKLTDVLSADAEKKKENAPTSYSNPNVLPEL